jgi:Fe-S-cluster containining protein
MREIISNISNIFQNVLFNECEKCDKKCCVSYPTIALYKEEKDIIRKYNKSIKRINNTFWMLDEKCKFYNQEKERCSIYSIRPFDCRLFPLDIIKKNNKYYWCIYTSCPSYKTIGKKLIPLIPLMEKKFTKSIINQDKKFASISKKIYWPCKKRKYKIIKELQVLCDIKGEGKERRKMKKEK